MKSFAIFLVSLALVAYAESRVAAEPPANQPVPLTELISQAQADIAKLGKELHASLNLPDQETVVNTLKTHSNTLVTNVKSYVDQVSEQLKTKSPELEKLWTSVKTTLNKAVDDITAQIPTAKDQVSQLEAKFLQGVNTIVKQSDLAAQNLSQKSGQIQEDVSKLAKKAVEIAVQATQQLNSQVQQHAIVKPTNP